MHSILSNYSSGTTWFFSPTHFIVSFGNSSPVNFSSEITLQQILQHICDRLLERNILLNSGKSYGPEQPKAVHYTRKILASYYFSGTWHHPIYMLYNHWLQIAAGGVLESGALYYISMPIFTALLVLSLGSTPSVALGKCPFPSKAIFSGTSPPKLPTLAKKLATHILTAARCLIALQWRWTPPTLTDLYAKM